MRVPLGHEHVRGQPLFALQTPQRAYLVAPASGGHSASRIVHVVANKPRAICFGSPSPPQPKKIYSLSGLPSTAAGIFLACLLHAHSAPKDVGMFYIHADPPRSLPPIPVRVSRRSQLTAALRQHARPIVIEDQELAGPFVRLLRARQ